MRGAGQSWSSRGQSWSSGQSELPVAARAAQVTVLSTLALPAKPGRPAPERVNPVGERPRPRHRVSRFTH